MSICTRIILAIIVSLILPFCYAFETSGEESAPSVVFKVAPTPNGHPKPFQNDLHSVSGSSTSDIWAVGQTAIHFNGTKWVAFPAQGIKGDNTSRLGGVVDFAPDNAWAVGLINIGLGNGNQVIEHFDGTKWSPFPGPRFQSGDQPALESVSAVSATDMWAAGFILTNNAQSLFPLLEHFDGTSWTAFKTTSGNASLFSVSAAATNDVWAVGTVAFSQTFTEHFDGNTWSVVPSPNPGFGFNVLTGVAVLAPNDAWAAGYFTQNPNSTRPAKTLIEHWDGTSWQVIPSPNVGPHSQYQSNQLYGLTAASASDIWAFGSFFAQDGSGQQSTLLLHWDGASWTIQPSPNPVDGNFRSDILFGGTILPQGDVWIVGNKFGSTLAIRGQGQ